MVKKYTQKLIDLGQFAMHFIATEKIQTESFQEGLQQKIQRQVDCHQIQNFHHLMKIAFIVECEWGNPMASSIGQKRRTHSSEGSNFRSSQKFISRGRDCMLPPKFAWEAELQYAIDLMRRLPPRRSPLLQVFVKKAEHYARGCPNAIQGNQVGQHCGRWGKIADASVSLRPISRELSR